MLLARKATIPQAARLEVGDIEAIALHVLWKTIEAYTPSKGAFTTYAYNRMPRLITNLAQTHVDAPRWVTDTGGGEYQVQRAYQRMMVRDGWPPSLAEIAAETGIRSEYVAAILSRSWMASTFTEVHDGDGDIVDLDDLLDDAHSITASTSAYSSDPARVVEKHAEIAFLLRCLSDRERRIVSALYMDDLTLREIGVEMNLTGEGVRRIAKIAVNKLRSSQTGAVAEI
jgi:RNA polymerase sigma factor for flagellar operon FliA